MVNLPENKTVALGGGFKYFQCSTLYGIFTYMYLVDFYGFHIPFMDPMDVNFELEMSRYSRYRSRLLKLCEKYYIV